MTCEPDTYTEDRGNVVSTALKVGLKKQVVSSATVDGYQVTPLRVMIADDVAMIRRFLGVVLESSWDYNVVGMVGDGSQAVAMAERLQPDIVLLDMLMPQTYGTGVLSGILRVAPHARVVIVSTIDPALEASLLEAGATGFLSKQASPLEFLNRLKDVLDRSTLEVGSQFM